MDGTTMGGAGRKRREKEGPDRNIGKTICTVKRGDLDKQGGSLRQKGRSKEITQGGGEGLFIFRGIDSAGRVA